MAKKKKVKTTNSNNKPKNTDKITNKDASINVESKQTGRLRTFVMGMRINPKDTSKATYDFFKRFFHNNKMFIIFVLFNVFNGFLLRFLTANENNNAFNIDPLLADLSIVLLLGSFSYFMKSKKYTYLKIITFILSIICIINSVYYTYYTSFTSITLLSIVKYSTSIGDAIFENVAQLKDFVYLIAPLTFIFIHRRYVKINYFETTDYYEKDKHKVVSFLIASAFCLAIFFCTCTSTDLSRLDKQWNREYIVMKCGIYLYHINDLVKSLEPKFVSIFGYDNAMKSFNDYFSSSDRKKYQGTNEYTNMFAGKNVLVIHAESIQNFLIDLKFNGQEVTPNLNKLAHSSLYFDNFYTQVSVGTSSDTEFTFNTSLMPAKYGTAFSNYFDKQYVSTPLLLKEKGYYTCSMHGNTGDFWNRRIMHANLGIDNLYAKNTYEIDEVIGLGISDESFFRQSVEKLKKINEEHTKWYDYVITLSNHTPFSNVDKYGEFDVDIKTDEIDPETGEQIVYPYMEDTKLGRYFKSAHYADEALGHFMEALDAEGLLENTVVVLFGDHDARLPQSEFNRLYNYDPTTNDVLPETDPNYKEFNEYHYELNRKTPLIIYSKDNEKNAKTVSYYMGMYDLMPTLGNMLGFENKYALGHDIFNIKDDNIIVFHTSNWLTKDMYYSAQKNEGYTIGEGVISEDYITKNNKYAEDLLKISNDILIYDLIRNSNTQASEVNEQELMEGTQ
jgi:phosphoglycerol transferase MdoB-like AlkP superfamily enzyme